MRHRARITAVALLLYWGFLTVMTHLPKPPPVGQELGDKTAHFIAYSFLAALLFLALWFNRPRMRFIALWVVVICLAFGAVDELTQPWFNRTADMRDWYYNVAGALAGSTAMAALRQAWRVLRSRGRGMATS